MKLRPGDPIIWEAQKHTTHPGPRAHDIVPDEQGDGYSYLVSKLWVVDDVRGEEVVARTRTGKRRRLNLNDHRLRKASLIDRVRYRGRFPRPDDDR